MDSKPRVIGPSPPKATPLPRWAAPLVIVGVVGALITPHLMALGVPLLIAGLGGAFVIALWLEDRVSAPFTHAPFVTRLGILAALVAVGLLANVVVSGVVRPAVMSHAMFLAPTVALAQLFVFWFLSAAFGGLPIVVANSIVGTLFKGFRRRVQVAVLMLVGVAVFFSVTIAVLGIAVLDALKHNETHFLVGNGQIAGIDVSPAALDAVLPWIDNPVIIVIAATLFGGLYGIPALLSATGKLADAIMERVSPLADGFDAIATGERGVTIEEGGADEMRAIIKRFNTMVGSLELAERMERAFGQYVSGHVLELIKSQHGEGALPASLREASVFFADIRGFTNMSERLQPQQVVHLLNRYFERVIRVIDEHEGYLNKFIGDAVVVVFNGPIEQPDHAARATRCAIEIEKLVAKMNDEGAFPEVGRIDVGIGVSTGPMVCGNVGGSRQMEYTVIGDTVNLAARLTSKAGAGEVWISDATARAVGGTLPCLALEPLHVKGKEQQVLPWRAWPHAHIDPNGIPAARDLPG
jgi:class 3 adenylate cyclase